MRWAAKWVITPTAWNSGTHTIALLPAAADDALLTALHRRFDTNLADSQSVLTFSSLDTVLGSSEHDPHQIMRYRPNVIRTQFHLEFNAPVMHSNLARMMAQEPERSDHYQQLEEQISATPHSQGLLARFVNRCLNGAVTD